MVISRVWAARKRTSGPLITGELWQLMKRGAQMYGGPPPRAAERKRPERKWTIPNSVPKQADNVQFI